MPHCTCRLACLALALHAEDPDCRQGWYGGASPTERGDLARTLGLVREPASPNIAGVAEAARLHEKGKTIREIAHVLGRSRRTIQRYLNGVA